MLTRRATLAGLAALAVSPRAYAQTFPSRTITIVVPYPPGGPIDALARLIAQEAAGDLGQVDRGREPPRRLGHHRHPCGGARGARRPYAGARHQPDARHQSEPDQELPLRRSAGFCAGRRHRRHAACAGGAQEPRRGERRRGGRDGEGKPGALTFGSMGNGSGAHLAGELFKTKAAIDMLHVPFKGLSPMLTELLADRIDLSIAPLPGLIGQQIEAGNVRALGVARAQRLPQLASVPTFAEAGVPRRRGRCVDRAVRAGEDAAGGGRAPLSRGGGGAVEGNGALEPWPSRDCRSRSRLPPRSPPCCRPRWRNGRR